MRVYLLPALALAALAFILLIYEALAGGGGGGNGGAAGPGTPAAGAGAFVCFIDAGQADSILLSSGEAVALIDAGEESGGGELTSKLRGLGVSKIDALIGTHPHSDHIGGMPAIIGAFEIGDIYFPRVYNNTRIFEKTLEAVAGAGLKINAPSPGDALELPGGLKLTFVGPVAEDDAKLNDSSLIIKAELATAGELTLITDNGAPRAVAAGQGGKFTVLLAGDAEYEAESLLLESGADVRADVLKAGHHGSATSTGADFLAAVDPAFAVITCGRDNPYGHPDRAVLDLLESRGVTVFRTDESGSITFSAKRD